MEKGFSYYNFGSLSSGSQPGPGTGSVTSVGVSAPTGFKVSGSPVTSSGIISLRYDASYGLPTLDSQTNWDTAYGWGNHAVAGYAHDSSVVKKIVIGTGGTEYSPLSGVVTIPSYPSTLAELSDDSTHRLVTDTQINNWDGIVNIVPSAAYITGNELADKSFVNSSIATATATHRGTYNLVTDLSLTTEATRSDIASALDASIATADKNDYCFVEIPTNTSTPTLILRTERYKYDGSIGWEYEYTLNNSGYTSDQWAAINSGLSSTDKTKLDGIELGATRVDSSTVSDWGYTKNLGTVTQINIDSSAYMPVNGVVTLPQYKMVVLKYGTSTWAEFIAAYSSDSIVYCRASSNADPGTGEQTRMAFMAYANDEDAPTEVEFQYYRSVSSHSATQQGDQVFVYKLTSSGVWSVTVRECATKIAAGTNMTSSYSSGVLTLNATASSSDMVVETFSTATLSPEVNKYYRATVDVSNLVVTLPAMSETDKVKCIVLHFTTGATANVTFESADNKDISYYAGYDIDVHTEYEINCLFGGNKWIISYSRIDGVQNFQQDVYSLPLSKITTQEYIGDFVDLSTHKYSSEQIGTLPSVGTSHQGAAVSGKYLFQCHHSNNAIVIYDLETRSTVQTINLTPDASNHCTMVTFGSEYYDQSDPFPCLYICADAEHKCYVYRIIYSNYSYSVSLVQTISYDTELYWANLIIDAPNNRGIIMGYTLNSYTIEEGNRFKGYCVDIPSINAGDVTLNTRYNEFELPFMYAIQGCLPKNGKIYISFGDNNNGPTFSGIIVYDYISKRMDSYIPLNAMGSYEPEGIGLYENSFIVTTYQGAIMQIVPDSPTSSSVVSFSGSNTTLRCFEDNVYVASSEVNTLAVTLPVTVTGKTRNISIFLNTGNLPVISFASPDSKTINYYASYSITANAKYEINALFNGYGWVISNAEIAV